MRTMGIVLCLAVIGTAAAETKVQTDAQQDKLSGPVRSASTTIERTPYRLDPASGWTIENVSSGNIDYDSKGYRTRVGGPTSPDGEFQGQISQLVEDANGRVIERTIMIMPSQEVMEHDSYGLFGLVKSTSFSSGKPTSEHTVSYDQRGDVQEDITVQGGGEESFRTLYRRNPDGVWTERTTWIKGAEHSHETYDPDSDFQRYEEYNDSAAVSRSFTYRHDRVESYWSASKENNGGISLISNLDNGNKKNWNCHDNESICVGRTLHGTYLDAAKHNPSMTEILSDDGTVLFRAYYEYQLDAHENWISRKVAMQSGDQGERTLYETDLRQLTYWPE